jgi:hypothetical protein
LVFPTRLLLLSLCLPLLLTSKLSLPLGVAGLRLS